MANSCGTVELSSLSAFISRLQMEAIMGRGILIWRIGVPIPVIIVLALVFHH